MWQGLVYVALLAAAAFAVGTVTSPYGLGASFVAIVLGMAFGRGPARFQAGIAWAAKPGLLLAIVLLGFQIDLRAFGGAFWKAAAIVAAGLLLAFLLARPLGIRRSLAIIMGAGFGVCGVAAVASTSRAAGASEEDVAYAVPVVTVVGAALMLALPLLQAAIGLDPWSYGTLAGAILPAVPQAIGAGFAAGATAGAAATTMKMARVALMPLAVLAVGLTHRRSKRAGIPFEVIGFVATVLIANVTTIPRILADSLAAISQTLLLAALVALGCLTHFQRIWSAGWRPLVLVAAVLAVAATVALV